MCEFTNRRDAQDAIEKLDQSELQGTYMNTESDAVLHRLLIPFCHPLLGAELCTRILFEQPNEACTHADLYNYSQWTQDSAVDFLAVQSVTTNFSIQGVQ